jgi:choline dehydrogenase-like flavoprotein
VTSNAMSKTNNHDVLEFDFVIVGAGPSAMGLLLGLLEAHCNGECLPFSVAILERGQSQIIDDDRLKSPCRWFEISHEASSSSRYVSMLHASLDNGRMVSIPTGRGVGGGSNINACLCVAPPVDDFRDWPEPWNLHVIESIQHVQNCLEQNKCLVDGMSTKSLKSSKTKPDCVPCIAKFNANNHQVERVNYFQGLIHSLLQKYKYMGEQLHWICGAEVQRLLIQEKTVIAVEVQMSSGSFITIRARKEVILCAGSLETPALLMASGIGTCEATTISGASNSFIIDGVGKNLRDHIILPRVLLAPTFRSSSINGIHKITPFDIGGDNKFLLLTTTTMPEIALHFFSDIVHNYWHSAVPSNSVFNFLWVILENLMWLLVLHTPIYYVLKFCFTTMNLSLVTPRSSGSVTIKPKEGLSSNSIHRRKDFDLQIDLGYLRDCQDVKALRDGWVASPIICPESFSNRLEIFPGALVRSLYQNFSQRSNANNRSKNAGDWFSSFAQDTYLPFFHWCGTCAIQSKRSGNKDDAWVVDSQLRVRTLRALRVCDASVFPNNLSVPPALACASIGHFLASLILEEHASQE